MNYSDFSFWWILFWFGLPFFTARALLKPRNLWHRSVDAIALMSVSLLLFANASFSSFVVFIFTIVFNYLMVSWMLAQDSWRAKAIATGVIVIDVAILAYFKYLTFFVEDVYGLLVGGVVPDWKQEFPIPVFSRIPPGVSFYTFQMVSFVVDSLQARKKKPINFIDYVNFIAFFPQIVAGPIERRISLLPQIEGFQFKFKLENLDLGCRWLALGLFMKFVLGDNLFPFIDVEPATNAWMVWFQAFLFTLRIYFDFAGYSFIALGLGYFLGVRLTVNFLAPYTSQSINEFWRRWHITLSTWFRDYVFLPLMGSKKQLAPLFLFLTFTLSGFWHGAAWNFIIWGAYHGALLLLLRYLGRPFQKWMGRYVSRPQVVSWGLTFGSVVLGCLFFMDTDIGRLLVKLRTLANPWAYSWGNLTEFFGSYNFNEGIALAIIVGLSILVLLCEQIAIWQGKFEYDLLLSHWMSPLLVGLTVLLAAKTPSEFIYFEF